MIEGQSKVSRRRDGRRVRFEWILIESQSKACRRDVEGRVQFEWVLIEGQPMIKDGCREDMGRLNDDKRNPMDDVDLVYIYAYFQ